MSLNEKELNEDLNSEEWVTHAHYICVELDLVKGDKQYANAIKNGLYIPPDAVHREDSATRYATIIGIGPLVFKIGEEHSLKLGDKVLIRRNAGEDYMCGSREHPDQFKRFRYLQYSDICAVYKPKRGHK